MNNFDYELDPNPQKSTTMKRKGRIVLLSVIVFCMFQQLSAQDELLFRRYLINSGINGFFYGLAIDYMIDAQDGAAAGIPIISSGIAVITPLIANSSKTISANSLILSSHGKFIGWAHGFALATLIGGDNAWESPNDKLTLAAGFVTSITLGFVGNSLGKTKPWTEGQASMYKLYGWTAPLTGTLMTASFSDASRAVAASDLLFAAGGYLLADVVYKKYQYTRGDARAVQVFTLLNGGLGFGIFADIATESESGGQTTLLFPAMGVMAGSVLGQLWVKNIQMTPRQGMSTAYATAGGALFGLGAALITGSDKVTPYYTIPYAGGLVAYAIMVESIRRKNSAQKNQSSFGDNQKARWNFALMPQNIFVNSKIAGHGYMMNGKLTGMQPLFAASLNF
jgi:hypothetical protein